MSVVKQKQSGGATVQPAMAIFWRVAYYRQVVAYDYKFPGDLIFDLRISRPWPTFITTTG